MESELPDYDPTPHDLKMAELAQPFSFERELAFFMVQIGLSRSDYESLTEKEKMFIRKEYENKFMKDTTWLRNAVLNAEVNAHRGKYKKFLELFPKKPRKADKKYNENAMQIILEMEKRNGKGWVDKIYKANGMKKPSPEKGGR